MSTPKILRSLALGVAFALAACGSDAVIDPDPNSDAADPPIPPAGEFTTLISADWDMAPGEEGYFCARVTVQEDTWITAFRSIAPTGTHHSVLTVGDPDGPDGVTRCGAGTNHGAMIYGAGIDTNDIAMPAGVAMRVRAGQQMLLNLHLFNLSEATLVETSAVEAVFVDEADVEQEAEVILMGKVITLQVPPGESTQTGTCEMNGDVTLFMVNPHMHQLGTHMRMVAERSGEEDVVLHDAPYEFEEQQIFPIAPVEMKRGDRVRVHCSYNNTTGQTVGFGDSSTEEMCFGTTYRYPAFGGTFGIVCAQD